MMNNFSRKIIALFASASIIFAEIGISSDNSCFTSNYLSDSFLLQTNAASNYLPYPEAPVVKTSSNYINLSWKKTQGTNGYILQKYSGGKFVTIYSGSKLSYTDKNVKSGNTYKYRVGVYKKSGNSTYYSYSSSVSVTACKTISLSKCSITLSSTSKVYNGKNQQPSVKVTYCGKNLAQGRDYLLYYNNQKNIGTASVTIKGCGKFNGSVKRTYKIVPVCNIAKPRCSCTYNSVSIKWSKADYANGYEVQKYDSKSKKFTTVAKTSKTSYTVKNLAANTSYKFRICPYRKLNGKTYYSNSPSISKKTLEKIKISKKEQDVLTRVNKERKSIGLKALSFDAELNQTALTRAKQVSKTVTSRSTFFLTNNDHYCTNSSKLAAVEILEKNNFDKFRYSSHSTIGENLAAGQDTSAEVVNSWMNSTHHRDNILNKSYSRIGISCYEYKNELYWVQVFSS